jgi:hypothetical protein
VPIPSDDALRTGKTPDEPAPAARDGGGAEVCVGDPPGSLVVSALRLAPVSSPADRCGRIWARCAQTAAVATAGVRVR